MATTTNFGWETPDDTDLVKDGAAAIRTALGGVDTSFVDLKGGTNGQILSKASNTDLDFTWVTNDDSYTLLSTTTLSGTSVTVNSISGAYKHLFIYSKGITSTTNADDLQMRFNGDTGSNYNNSYIRCIGTTVTGFSINTTNLQIIQRLQSSSTVQKLGYGSTWIYRYTSTDHIDVSTQSRGNDGTDGFIGTLTQTYDASAAISSITFFSGSGGTLGGTIYIYGVK